MPKRRKDKDGNEIFTAREQRLIELRAQGKTIAQAALEAGYAPVSAHAIGSETLEKPEIQRAVQQRIRDITEADKSEVLQLFAAHLRGDPADFADCFLEDGRLDWDKAKARGISRLIKDYDCEPIALRLGDEGEIVTRYRVKIRFYSSQTSAAKLADIQGIKQQPRQNEHDEQKRRDLALDQLKQVMERLGLERDQAIAWMREHVPAAARWIN